VVTSEAAADAARRRRRRETEQESAAAAPPVATVEAKLVSAVEAKPATQVTTVEAVACSGAGCGGGSPEGYAEGEEDRAQEIVRLADEVFAEGGAAAGGGATITHTVNTPLRSPVIKLTALAVCGRALA